MDLTRDFLERMLIRLNPNIDDEELDFFVDDTEEVLWDFLMANIAEKLTDEQIASFSALVEKEVSDDELMIFLRKNIKDADNFLRWVYKEFEEIYIEEAKKLGDELT